MLTALALSLGVHTLTGLVAVRLGDSIIGGGRRGDKPLVLAEPPESLLRDPSLPQPAPAPESPAPESVPIAVRPPDSPPPPPPPPPPPVIEVTPGVDGSTANVQTWKGFAEATEHKAPKFVVEQAGLTPAPGAAASEEEAARSAEARAAEAAPDEPAATETAPAESPSQPMGQTPPAEVEARIPAPGPAPAPEQTLQADAIEPKPGAETPSPPLLMDPPAETSLLGILPPLAPQQSSLVMLNPPDPQPDQPTLQEPAADQPATTLPGTHAEPSPAQSQSARPTGEPGLRADDESAARSMEDAIVVRPGKPIARPGLNIKTATARFSPSTIVLNRPKNPLVRITFGRSGRVLLAEFVPGQTTGSADVDKPLLDSLHRWSARGKDLLRIPENDPNAGVTLTFRIVF
ncbi:hypothetical protein PHYC_02879 [Phycisphaerales bacterium]|nr:hypothetical protein PHYC_02879 [Phycisphaerales bacterium]